MNAQTTANASLSYTAQAGQCLSDACVAETFGESFVSQRLAGAPARYTFSAKEKDSETGYSYFGARYYESGLSVWLSVDPLSDERSWLTPYNYCQNNPVILTDPSGMLDDWIYNQKTEEYVWDGTVTNPSETPSGYEYVGPSIEDVVKHNDSSGKRGSPKFGENRTRWPGEIRPAATTGASGIETWLMKKTIIIITILLAILTGYFYFYFISPIFIGTRDANKTPYCNWSKHKCNPIRNTDFSTGDNEILI